jgi:uncharacterized protein YndB with AHSA1/START domain
MSVVEVSRTLAAAQEDVWAVIADPHHLSRWWPRVTRVEGVDGDRFTEVLTTAKGRSVRADFTIVEADPPRRARWRQELEGSPFARVLAEAETELRLAPAADGAGTEVTLVARETAHGMSNRLGTFLMRRAARQRLSDALEGLARIVG